MDSFSDYALFGLLLVAGIVMAVGGIVAPLFLSPRSKGAMREETYECGVDTIGSAWVRFGIAFYLFALIFVAFEVDVLYLLPVLTVYDTAGYVWRDLVEVSLFLGILSLALVYAWRKGVFTPERSPSRVPEAEQSTGEAK